MSFFSKIRKAIKKIGKKIMPTLKKVAPIGLGIGGALLGGPAIGSALGGLFSAKSADTGFVGPPDPNQVQVTGQKEGFDWGGLAKAAVPLASGALNYAGQIAANSANAKMAQQQMDFQEQMSNTSYQRGMEDMEKAGLNPLLAYSQGGASTPGGASAQMQNELGEGANSALSAWQTIESLKNLSLQGENLQAQNALIDAQTRNVDADTIDKGFRPALTQAQTAQTGKSSEYTESQIKFQLLRNRQLRESIEDEISRTHSAAQIGRAEAAGAQYDLHKRKAYGDFYKSDIGSKYPWIEAAGETANSAISAIGKSLRLGKFGF